ncbi:hypothetical protein BCR42DRAFT_407046 [Absidia repens]|uniref:Ams2/SPT21 N-terminal domain-containing protein n=1 Tax=Absidia repens TaxID=90262 RepID=A0A1X2IRM5_9FUNG|nr:hypothetical protein BCR42DRAFT_407046 [Absidia repens]
MDIQHSSTKVKVYYSLKGSQSTRLATFPFKYDHDTTTSSLVAVPLKTCLWAICSSSPDMVCREHDLSIYSANFQESGNGSHHVDQLDSLIWEGHGLMSWVMEDQHTSEIYVNGKVNQHHIDVYVELQPTLKWCKSDFYNALQSQDFSGFKHASSTSTARHPSSTNSCTCGVYASLCTQQEQQYEHKQQQKQNATDTKRRRLTPPPTPLESSISPTLPSLSIATKATHSSPPRLPPPASIISTTSPSPSSLFRPEPILPSPEFYRRSLPPQGNPPPPPILDERHHPHQHHYQHGSSSYAPLTSSMQPQHDPAPYNNRSAFTPTMTQTDYSSPLSKNHHELMQPTSSLPSSSSSPTNIPVIYTPSNKKRKKYPPMIMPADGKKLPNGPHSRNQQQVQHPQQQQQQNMQQVSTAVRTYYEVDRDDCGRYILPVEIDSWTVVDLGTAVYDRPAYHNQRYIYPVNYTVRKWYRSMVDAKSDTQYTCRILDNGREPKFEVTADDCPMTYSGPTPTTVWTIIVRRAFAIRNQEYGHNPVGPDFFGLRKNTIAKMIQDLPNVDKCTQYVWQTFEPARFNKPGRNRRRLDTMISGSILGGVNYGLTSGRLNTVASHQQHQLKIRQRRLSSSAGITGTIETNSTHRIIPSSLSSASSTSSSSSRDDCPSPTISIPPSLPTKDHHHSQQQANTTRKSTSPSSSSPSYLQSPPYHSTFLASNDPALSSTTPTAPIGSA